MPRQAAVMLALLTIVGSIVAVLPAQESSRRTARRPTNSDAVRKPSSISDRDEPTLARPSEAPIHTARRQGGLADRLRAVRRNMTPPAQIEDSGTVDSKNGDSNVTRNSQPTEARTPRPLAGPTNQAQNPEVEGTDEEDRLPSVLRPGDSDSEEELESTERSSTSARKALGGMSARTATQVPGQLAPPADAPAELSNEVSAEGDTEVPTSIEASKDGGNIVLASRIPSINVETIGPRAIVLGKEAIYQITIQNQGEEPANDLLVQIAIPDAIKLVTSEPSVGNVTTQTANKPGRRIAWSVPHVESRSREQLTLHVVPQESRPFELAVDWSLRPITSTTSIEIQEPKLEMTIGGPNDVQFGETKVYHIVLTNPGTGSAEAVTLSLGPGTGEIDTKQIGTLAAGERREIDIELTARESGVMEIRAVAGADGGLKADAAKQVRVRRADLQIQIAAAKLKYAGARANYQIRVTNKGDAVANDVAATAALPQGSKYVAGIEGGTFTNEMLNWQIGRLEPGMERVFNVQCLLLSAGEQTFTVRVEDDHELSASNSAVTRVEAIADLKLQINDPQGPKSLDEDVVYEIEIVNRGTKAAQQISLVAQFANGIEPTQASHPAEIVPGQVVFEPIDRLGAGEKLIVKVTARAKQGGNLRFRAELKCTEPDTQLVAEETTRFFGDK